MCGFPNREGEDSLPTGWHKQPAALTPVKVKVKGVEN